MFRCKFWCGCCCCCFCFCFCSCWCRLSLIFVRLVNSSLSAAVFLQYGDYCSFCFTSLHFTSAANALQQSPSSTAGVVRCIVIEIRYNCKWIASGFRAEFGLWSATVFHSSLRWGKKSCWWLLGSPPLACTLAHDVIKPLRRNFPATDDCQPSAQSSNRPTIGPLNRVKAKNRGRNP